MRVFGVPHSPYIEPRVMWSIRRRVRVLRRERERGSPHCLATRVGEQLDRGRDGPLGPPPAQIRACGTTALGSRLGFDP